MTAPLVFIAFSHLGICVPPLWRGGAFLFLLNHLDLCTVGTFVGVIERSSTILSSIEVLRVKLGVNRDRESFFSSPVY